MAIWTWCTHRVPRAQPNQDVSVRCGVDLERDGSGLSNGHAPCSCCSIPITITFAFEFDGSQWKVGPLELIVMRVSRVFRITIVGIIEQKQLYFLVFVFEFEVDPSWELCDITDEFVLRIGDGFSEHVLELLLQWVFSPFTQLPSTWYHYFPEGRNGSLNSCSDFLDGVFGLLKVFSPEIIHLILDFKELLGVLQQLRVYPCVVVSLKGLNSFLKINNESFKSLYLLTMPSSYDFCFGLMVDLNWLCLEIELSGFIDNWYEYRHFSIMRNG